MASENQIVEHGPLLKCKCPGCQEQHEFHIVEEVIPASFLMKLMLMFDRSEFRLICQGCQYAQRVTPEEASLVIEVKKQTAEDKSPEQVAAFEEQMNQLEFIGKLFNDSLGWQCPKCDEQVAYNYQACWNCSTAHPQYEGGSEPPKFIHPMG